MRHMRKLMVVGWLIVLLSFAVTSHLFAQDTVEVVLDLELLADYPCIQYWVDAWNGEADAMLDTGREFITEDFRTYLSYRSGVTQSRSSFLGHIRDLRQNIPDFMLEVNDVIVGEDAVVIRYTASGTDPFSDTPQSFEFEGFGVFYLADGKIEEVWNWYNQCTSPWVTCSLS